MVHKVIAEGKGKGIEIVLLVKKQLTKSQGRDKGAT